MRLQLLDPSDAVVVHIAANVPGALKYKLVSRWPDGNALYPLLFVGDLYALVWNSRLADHVIID